mmetsp:Transcript_22827/g.33832  ORF Transcript_22827/g.33832 Transcript_22827/m.33832 type:complete len:627 (+) Transcript_22827:1-1881(+)
MKAKLVTNLLVIAGLLSLAAAAKTCETALQYECPLCNGTLVSSCLNCEGYLNADQNHHICFNRNLFGTHDFLDHDNHYPFLWNDIAGTIIWFIAAGIATACGVGGGGIYVPLGIILLRFSSKPASGLSQASIFGASVGGLILNIRNRHPDTKIRDTLGKRTQDLKVVPYEAGRSQAQVASDEHRYLLLDNGEHKFFTRPLIDYDMALFLAPMEMAGAVLGVIIQKLMPNWLFLSLAGVILGMTSLKTYQKFRSSYRHDKDAREERRLAEERHAAEEDIGLDGDEVPNPDEEASSRPDDTAAESGERHDADLAGGASTNVPEDERQGVSGNELCDSMRSQDSYGSDDCTDEATVMLEDDQEKLEKRRELLTQDARQYPIEKIIYLLILWIGLAIITFLKGGKGVDSLIGITCKSPWYSVLVGVQFLWLLGFAAVFGNKLVTRHSMKCESNYPFHQTDVLWGAAQLRFYSSFTFLAGIVAGLIGIGGGMVLGPMMLVMGIHPRVSSATTATMIVLTSSSVAIMFVTSGLVPWEYAVFFFSVCLCGAFIGKKYIDAYVTKTGMASILIGILATIIGLATIGCFVIVILDLKTADWCFDGFKPFCVVNAGTGPLSCAAPDTLAAGELFPY